MNSPLGRRPNPETWPRNSPAYHAAKRAVYAIAGLTKATATLTTRRPTVAQAFDLLDRADSLARAIEVLTLVDGEATPPPRIAANIAAHIADTSRALTGTTAAWRHYLPDLHAQNAAVRMTSELSRSLAALAALERQNPKEPNDEQP